MWPMGYRSCSHFWSYQTLLGYIFASSLFNNLYPSLRLHWLPMHPIRGFNVSAGSDRWGHGGIEELES